MIVTDTFVYLHMHRTAGTFLRTFFARYFPDASEIGYHYPAREIPAPAAHLPVLIMVRDPLDWYASIYHVNMLRMASHASAPTQVFAEVSKGGALDLSASLTRLVRLGERTPAAALMRRRISATLPISLEGNRGLGITTAEIDAFVSDDTGYYSWLFDRMTAGAWPRLSVVHYEAFKTELPAALARCGVNMSSDMLEYLHNAAPLNVSPNSARPSLITEPLRALILQKDAQIFRSFYADQEGFLHKTTTRS